MENLKLTPTELLEYYFCPRFIYYMDVLKIPQHEELRYKVQKGREVHEERRRHNRGYLWKKVGAVRRFSDVYLVSERYHLQGIVDEVVELADGSLAPIDYKYAIYPEYVYRSHRSQILSYCLLVEDVYKKLVNWGFIFYIREGNRQVSVRYGERERDKVINDIKEVLRVIEGEVIPDKTKNLEACKDCAYKNICV